MIDSPFQTPVNREGFFDEKDASDRAWIAGALVVLPVPCAMALLYAASFVSHVLVGPLSLLLIPAVLLSFGLGVRLGLRAFRELRTLPGASGEASFWLALLAIPFGAIGVGLTVLATLGAFARGRQIRRRGRAIFGEVGPGDAWLLAPERASDLHDSDLHDSDLPAPDALDAVAAEAWRRNGLTEHASVAAFAQLSAELMALGAPPHLIRTAHEDALDELHHTELCFSLAHALDGRRQSPGAFSAPPSAGPVRVRSAALARLAVTSLVDGALNEGVSARVIAELARTSTRAEVRAVLERIARDEARHAAHAWHTVRWCLDEGGFPVASALRAALFALPSALKGGLTAAAAEGALEGHGIAGHAREQRAFVLERRRVVARAERILAGARPGRSPRTAPRSTAARPLGPALEPRVRPAV